MKVIIVIHLICAKIVLGQDTGNTYNTYNNIILPHQQQQCQENDEACNSAQNQVAWNNCQKGDRGAVGKSGPKGDVGAPGQPANLQSYVDEMQEMRDVISILTSKVENLQGKLDEVKPKSCKEIKKMYPDSKSGLYSIYGQNNQAYRVFCEMTTALGGWTLVASIHENDMGGKCTSGDKWSSEHGYDASKRNGDGNWNNEAIFGDVQSSTSDDYKNSGYYELQADDVMVLQVPNETPVSRLISSAYFQYYTSDAFLKLYGGNLFYLFKRYPLLHQTYSRGQNGPSVPVTFSIGTPDASFEQAPPNPKSRSELEMGFIQFRVVNNESGVFAFCPFGKVTVGHNTEHYCIGGTSYQPESKRQCGDFAGFDWDGYGTHRSWSTSRIATESVYMLLYR